MKYEGGLMVCGKTGASISKRSLPVQISTMLLGVVGGRKNGTFVSSVVVSQKWRLLLRLNGKVFITGL